MVGPKVLLKYFKRILYIKALFHTKEGKIIITSCNKRSSLLRTYGLMVERLERFQEAGSNPATFIFYTFSKNALFFPLNDISTYNLHKTDRAIFMSESTLLYL